MPRNPFLAACAVVIALHPGARLAVADDKADRATLADTVSKIASGAVELADAAKASDDRAVRRKVGPAAADLADDLTALARRLGKDVSMQAIGRDAAAIEKDAAALVELADEADEKGERKALRARATLIHQSITAVRRTIETISGKEAAGAPRVKSHTGRLVNDSNGDKCDISENMRFVITRDGQSAFSSQMVFPGKDVTLVLERGRYSVQLLDTSSKNLGGRVLDVASEGWVFRSGCVNQD